MSLLGVLQGAPTLEAGAATPIIATLATEAISAALWGASQQPPTWGVFDSSGNLVIPADSVLDFDHEQEYDIADFPIQEGQFASYNKVVQPWMDHVRLSKGGTLQDRIDFLNAIEQILPSTNLYTIQTPEYTYQNVNLKRWRITRQGASGAYFLTEVDLYFVQILQVTAQYTTSALPNAQNASDQPVSNVGNVTLQSETSQVEAAANAAYASVASGLF